jgi:hypothetical protein
MIVLLYSIAFMSAFIGIAGGLYYSDFNLASNGLLSAVLCAAFGRIVQLLSKIEAHLKISQITARMREERRIADALFPPRPIKPTRKSQSVVERMRTMLEDIRS